MRVFFFFVFISFFSTLGLLSHISNLLEPIRRPPLLLLLLNTGALLLHQSSFAPSTRPGSMASTLSLARLLKDLMLSIKLSLSVPIAARPPPLSRLPRVESCKTKARRSRSTPTETDQKLKDLDSRSTPVRHALNFKIEMPVALCRAYRYFVGQARLYPEVDLL